MKDDATPTNPIANPHDHDYGTLFYVWFGAYAETCVYVWTKGDACDTAFEHAVDYLHENGWRGYLTLGPDDSEDDMTIIGHTTYPEAKGMPAVPSWEWGLIEVTVPETIAKIRERSIQLVEDE